MELTLAERLTLAGTLPQEGSFATLRTANLLREKLLPTAEEIDEYEIEDVEGGGIRWSRTAATMTFDIDVTNAERLAVTDLLRKLDADEALTAQHVSLYEKFVEG